MPDENKQLPELPAEILFNIFTYLDKYDLANMALVCTLFLRISNTPNLWHKLLCQNRNIGFFDSVDYKHLIANNFTLIKPTPINDEPYNDPTYYGARLLPGGATFLKDPNILLCYDVIKKEQSLYVEYFFDGYIYALKMLQNPSQLVFSYLSDEELIIESHKYYHFMDNVAALKDDVVNLKQRSATRDPLINKSLLIIGARYGLDLRALHEFISSPLAYLLPHFAEKDLFDWFSKQAFLNDSGQGLIKTMVNAIDHVCEELEQAHEQEQEEEYSSVTTCTLL